MEGRPITGGVRTLNSVAVDQDLQRVARVKLRKFIKTYRRRLACRKLQLAPRLTITVKVQWAGGVSGGGGRYGRTKTTLTLLPLSWVSYRAFSKDKPNRGGVKSVQHITVRQHEPRQQQPWQSENKV